MINDFIVSKLEDVDVNDLWLQQWRTYIKKDIHPKQLILLE